MTTQSSHAHLNEDTEYIAPTSLSPRSNTVSAAGRRRDGQSSWLNTSASGKEDTKLTAILWYDNEAMIPRRLFLGPARAQALASRPLTKPCLVRLAHASAHLSPAGASSSGVATRAVGTRERLLSGNSPGGRPTLQPPGFGNHLKKWETTATGEEKSGHINAGANETILFYDNLFPLKLSYGWMSYLVGRPWGADQDLSNLLQRFNKSSLGIADPINLVKRGIPKDDSLV